MATATLVQKMPAEVDGATTMTVDGVQVYKGGLVGNLNAVITQKFKDNGFTKTACPDTVTPETKEFDCIATVTAANGPKTLTIRTKLTALGDYDFHVNTPGFVALKFAAVIPGEVKSTPLTDVDCGKGTLSVNIGESFECKAINAMTKKPVKVVVTSKPNESFDFVVSASSPSSR